MFAKFVLSIVRFYHKIRETQAKTIMSRQVVSLDEVKNLRLVNDKPIRLLFLSEATSNIGFILFVFLYPSIFLGLFHQHKEQITPLTCHILFWWGSWLVVFTGLMFAAVPSNCSTPTLTAGLVHVRRFIYWGLLTSELFLIGLLLSPKYQTIPAIGFSGFLLFVIIGRLTVLFPKKEWFGTVFLTPQ